jgi:protein lifeguard
LTHKFHFLDSNQQQNYGNSPYSPPPVGFQTSGYPPQPTYPPQQEGYSQLGHMPDYPQQAPYNDPEDPFAKNFDFSDESIRKGFIKKVYSILTVQLSITIAFIALFSFHQQTKLWIFHNVWLFWVALVILIVTMIALACFESVRRTSPMNFVFLGIFTVAEAFLLGISAATYDTDLVLMAAGLTAAVCVGLTIFAFQTKWDFTVCRGDLQNE